MFLFFITIATVDAQNRAIDSLGRLLASAKTDTARIMLMADLGGEWVDLNSDSAQAIASKALKLAEATGFVRGQIFCLKLHSTICNHSGNPVKGEMFSRKAMKLCFDNDLQPLLANVYPSLVENLRLQGQYDSAYKYTMLELEIFKEQKNDKGILIAYNGLGIIARRKGHLSEALGYYQQALNKALSVRHKPRELMVRTNMALVYDEMGDKQRALDMNIAIYKEQLQLNDYYNITNTLANMGSLYAELGKPEEAKKNYEELLRVAEKYKIPRALGTAYNNLATWHYEREEYEEAEVYLLKSIELKKQTGDQSGLANAWSNLGDIYGMMKKYAKALDCFKKAIDINKSLGEAAHLRDSYGGISDCYAKMGDAEGKTALAAEYYKKAYDYYRLYKAYGDTILNTENGKVLREMQTKYDTEAKEKENQLLTEKNSMNEEKIRQQTTRILFLGAFFVIVAALSFFLFRSNFQKRKANKLLTKQKEELALQKDVISYKNKEITDSIRYAEKIQAAILPTEQKFKTVFPESFVFYEPKDIVGGDFYWMMETRDFVFWATADCTGHGVPGGFMTMLGISFLEEIVAETKTTATNEILDKLSEKLILALHQAERSDELQKTENKSTLSEIKDGMDMSLLRFNKRNYELQYSAANNGFYIWKNGSLLEMDADKRPVGFYWDKIKPFSAKVVQVEKGDLIFTYTDGYPDQFGGPHRKKYKYKKLEALFAAIGHLPAIEQKNKVSVEFTEWKGSFEQVDDVLIIGIRA